MTIGILSSSRADFGIYLPLLRRLKNDVQINLRIIAFGSHLSHYHGYTLQEIEQASLGSIDTVTSLLLTDEADSIATAYGLTVIKFSEYWKSNKFDLVLCLGDRYEMAAAVQAGIPFGVRFCHLHGGETTTGAIDNIYRHQISIATALHFTATAEYAKRIQQLTGSKKNIHHTGALSIDDVVNMELPEEHELRRIYQIAEGPYLLVTFHPETVNYSRNEHYADEMYKALKKLSDKFAIVVTMPNTDTQGTVYRNKLHQLKRNLPDRICIVEHFGKTNYFAAMKYAALLLGNTSSGIIEAASYNKYVVNVGDRQKNRARSGNVNDVPFYADLIAETTLRLAEKGHYKGENVYYKANAAENMHKLIREYLSENANQ